MKKIVSILSVLILLLIAAMLLIPVLFKGKILEIVEEQVNQNVNAIVSIGDVDLSLFKQFPKLSVTINHLDVENKAPFEGLHLAKVDEIVLGVDLFSVFSDGAIEIDNISVINPSLFVKVLKDGTANYDIAISTDEEETLEEETDESSDFNLTVKRYAIEGANLKYNDATMAFETEILNLNHSGKGDFSLVDFVLETTTSIDALSLTYEGVNYINKANIHLLAHLGMNMDEMRFELLKNELKLNNLSLETNGSIVMGEEDMLLDLNINAINNTFKDLLSMVPAVYATDFEGLKAEGKFSLKANTKGIYNESSMPAFDISLTVNNGKIQYPDLPEAIDNIALSLLVNSPQNADLNKMRLKVDNLSADIAKNPIALKLLLLNPITDPLIDASLKADIDFQSIKNALPLDGMNLKGQLKSDLGFKGALSSIEKEDYEAFDAHGGFNLKNFVVEGDSIMYPITISELDATITPAFASLHTLKGNAVGTNFEASGKVDNYISYILADEVIHGSFALHADRVDLNPFMVAEGNSEDGTEAVPTEEEMAVINIPANINFELSASLDELLYDKMSIKNFNGELLVKDEAVRFNNANMETLKGSVNLNGSYSSKNNDPKFDFAYKVTNIDVAELSKNMASVVTMAPILKKATGKFNSTFTIEGRLKDNMDPDYKSLNGKGNVQTLNVFFEEFEPLNKLASKLKLERFTKQRIDDTNISFTIEDGGIRVKPFKTKLGGIPTGVMGLTTFDQQIDYDLDMAIPSKLLGSTASEVIGSLQSSLNNKLGTNFSVGETVNVKAKLTNTITNPKIGLDFGKNSGGNSKPVTEQIVDKAKEELAKKKAEAEARAREEADKLKKQAQDEVDKAKAEAKRKIEEQKQRLEEEKRKAEEAAKKKAAEEAKKKLKGLFGGDN